MVRASWRKPGRNGVNVMAKAQFVVAATVQAAGPAWKSLFQDKEKLGAPERPTNE
jgi:hypothetical protein